MLTSTSSGRFPYFPAWLMLFLASVVFCGATRPCLAHPMGNFSINHYSGIHIERDLVEVRYMIDIAEIPTYQEMQNSGITAQAGDSSIVPYLTKQAALWVAGLHLQIGNDVIHLIPVSNSIIFPPGAGGLPTMKIGIVYRGQVPLRKTPTMHLTYSDGNYAGHAGWKEIVVTPGQDVTLAAGQLHQTDRSDRLSNYPTDLLSSPPQDLEAEVDYTLNSAIAPPTHEALMTLTSQAREAAVPPHFLAPSGVAGKVSAAAPEAVSSRGAVSTLQLVPNRQATPRNRFTELMTRQTVSAWFLLTAACLAAGLGALHALEPGHGKTIVAAYLVGSRGRMRHAIGLGLLVTAAHTAGVYLLGAVVLYASKYVIPEQIYPWLSIFSGLVIAVLALYLLLRAWTGFNHADVQDAGVLHTHWYSFRQPPIETEASLAMSGDSNQNRTVPLKQLLLLGITGGIIPCPAALVVLLSAVSLHRVGLGLFLIVAFSFGLAGVLIAIGIAMVKARTLLSRWRSDSPLIKRWLPLASASAMMIAGLAIAISALPATGLKWRMPEVGGSHVASFAAVVALGLVLGMRHSTDPDHVVAVSTIVSRERSVRHGAVIGIMWGLGHTLTIFVVGSAIILFNLTIPARLGLSMEMAVAAMLILLGMLNLTGLLRKLTERLTPKAPKSKGSLLALDGIPASGQADPSQQRYRRLVTSFGYYQLLRPLLIGLVHGLAGSAAVALLVLSMIHSPTWAIAYLIVFGMGTVIGMMLMTTVISVPIVLSGRDFSRYFTLASGLISVCFGIFLVYQLGFVDGLFTSHAHWTPE